MFQACIMDKIDTKTASAKGANGSTPQNIKRTIDANVSTPQFDATDPWASVRPKQANMSQTETGKDKLEMSGLIINELLCYVDNYRHSSSRVMLRDTVKQYFTHEDVLHAKAKLFAICVDEIKDLNIPPQRRASPQRSAQEADIEDILSIFEHVDDKRILPTFAAVNLNKIPKFNPEEVDMYSVVQRLNKLEHQVKSNSDWISKSTQNAKSYSDVLQGQTSGVSAAKPQAESTKIPNAMREPSNIRSDDDGFTIPRYLRRKLNKENRGNSSGQPKVVVGNATPTGLKGAKSNPYTNVFVYRTEKGTSEDSVKQHMQSKGVIPVEIERKSGSFQRYDSFRVSIRKEDWNTVMQSGFWPEGVRCRYFHPPRRVPMERGSPNFSISSSEVDTLAEHKDLSRNADDNWHLGSSLHNIGSNGNDSIIEDWDKQD